MIVALPDVQRRMPLLHQGATNGCGTTTLAMAISYLGQRLGREDVDRVIRRLDSFTAPGRMLSFARDRGLAASGWSHATLTGVRHLLARGVPVQLLIDHGTAKKWSDLHYVLATAVDCGADGRVRRVQLRDPHGAERWCEAARLLEHWRAPLGFTRCAFAYAPAGTALPPTGLRGVAGVVAAAGWITRACDAAQRVGRGPGRARALLFLPLCAAMTAVVLPGALVDLLRVPARA